MKKYFLKYQIYHKCHFTWERFNFMIIIQNLVIEYNFAGMEIAYTYNFIMNKQKRYRNRILI